MKKTLRIVVIVGIVLSLIIVLKYFKDANSSEIIDYETETPFYTAIVKEVVATGKLNPEDEIELKPLLCIRLQASLKHSFELLLQNHLFWQQ